MITAECLASFLEDNKFMQDVLRIVMDSLGVRNYYFASDGKEAVEIIQLRSGTLKELPAAEVLIASSPMW